MKTHSKTNPPAGSESASSSTAPVPAPRPLPSALTGQSRPKFIAAEQSAETFQIGRSPSAEIPAASSTSPSSSPASASSAKDQALPVRDEHHDDLQTLKRHYHAFVDVAARIFARLDTTVDVRIITKLPKIFAIQELVAAHYQLPITVMTSRRKHSHLVRARHVAIELCRNLTNYRTQDIGDCFNCDHSNVLHASNQMRNLQNQDAGFLNEMNRLRLIASERLENIDMPLFEMIQKMVNKKAEGGK